MWFDRLAERVRAVIHQDPLSDSLFIFRSRRGDRLKVLTWDRDGFVLWQARVTAIIYALLGFKNFDSAAITIAGIELLPRIHKGQFALGRLRLKDQPTPAVWNAVLGE
jgi:hypothetical protein